MASDDRTGDLEKEMPSEMLAITATPKKADTKEYSTDDFIISDFIDLTDDYLCYVCEQVIKQPTYCLTTGTTLRSKVPIAEKLGEALGKRYIAVISDDDYICEDCKTLLDKLDGPPKQAKRFKTVIRKLIEYTYCFSKDTISVMRNSEYKKLQLMFDRQDLETSQPPRKRSRFNSPLLSKKIKAEPYEEPVTAMNINKIAPCDDMDLAAIGHEYCFQCNEMNEDFSAKSIQDMVNRQFQCVPVMRQC